MKVEAKDIPIIQKFMTEYWKAIKEFYSAELTDEYSSKVYGHVRTRATNSSCLTT